VSQPSHTAASHINALAKKHYPRRLTHPKPFKGTYEEFVALMEADTPKATEQVQHGTQAS